MDFPLSQLQQGAGTGDWDFSRNRVYSNAYIKSSNKKQEYVRFAYEVMSEGVLLSYLLLQCRCTAVQGMPNMPCISPHIHQSSSGIYSCYEQHLKLQYGRN